MDTGDRQNNAELHSRRRDKKGRDFGKDRKTGGKI